jgi:hypothetical protein
MSSLITKSNVDAILGGGVSRAADRGLLPILQPSSDSDSRSIASSKSQAEA